MERIDIINISLSITAIFISIISLLFTSPLIVDKINEPVLRMVLSYPMIYDDKVITWCKVNNSGRSTSKNISIKMLCLEKDEINISSTGTNKLRLVNNEKLNFETQYLVEERIYEISDITPREGVLLTIKSNRKDWDQMKLEGGLKSSFGSLYVPDVINLISPGSKIVLNKTRVKPERDKKNGVIKF